MNRIKLGNTGIETSRLGFGCSQLTTHPERRDAIGMLEHAFGLGITHFDVARLYGFGRAEGIVGEFLRGKRDKVTVATKFGMQPPTGVTSHWRAVALAKKILGPFPGLLRRLKKRRFQQLQTGVFTPEAAVASLEVSLRELGTDHVDIFLLHEATLADAASETLIEALRQQVARGTIRSLGIGSRFANLQAGNGEIPTAYQVAQFEDNVVERNLAALAGKAGRAVVTHSVFKPYGGLRTAIAGQAELTRRYSSEMNVQLEDSRALGSLLWHYALRSNAGGVVLFSSLDRTRVTANVRDAEACPFSEQQLEKFVEFVGAVIRGDQAGQVIAESSV
jgi:D-threo-aldose 1-dehydrogenase